MNTKLEKIESIQELSISPERVAQIGLDIEKQVDYDEIHETYTIRLTFLNNEAEYVLSKLRFLGKRVHVIEGEHLPRRDLLFRFKPKKSKPP